MDGNDGLVHATLLQLTKLIQAYGHTRPERPLDLRPGHVDAYSTLVAAFLADIDACGAGDGLSSVDSVSALCPCCATPYGHCVQAFEGIGALVPLGRETELALYQLQMLAQLPRVESALGLSKRDVPLVYDDVMPEDDESVVLGHFDSDDDDCYNSDEL
jgi:hypothetical protein